MLASELWNLHQWVCRVCNCKELQTLPAHKDHMRVYTVNIMVVCTITFVATGAQMTPVSHVPSSLVSHGLLNPFLKCVSNFLQFLHFLFCLWFCYGCWWGWDPGSWAWWQALLLSYSQPLGFLPLSILLSWPWGHSWVCLWYALQPALHYSSFPRKLSNEGSTQADWDP